MKRSQKTMLSLRGSEKHVDRDAVGDKLATGDQGCKDEAEDDEKTNIKNSISIGGTTCWQQAVTITANVAFIVLSDFSGSPDHPEKATVKRTLLKRMPRAFAPADEEW